MQIIRQPSTRHLHLRSQLNTSIRSWRETYHKSPRWQRWRACFSVLKTCLSLCNWRSSSFQKVRISCLYTTNIYCWGAYLLFATGVQRCSLWLCLGIADAFEKDVGLNLLQLLDGDKSVAAVDSVMMQSNNNNNSKYEKQELSMRTAMFPKRITQRGLMQAETIPTALVPAVEQVKFLQYTTHLITGPGVSPWQTFWNWRASGRHGPVGVATCSSSESKALLILIRVTTCWRLTMNGLLWQWII